METEKKPRCEMEPPTPMDGIALVAMPPGLRCEKPLLHRGDCTAWFLEELGGVVWRRRYRWNPARGVTSIDWRRVPPTYECPNGCESPRPGWWGAPPGSAPDAPRPCSNCDAPLTEIPATMEGR